MSTVSATEATPDLQALKARQKATWEAGDFGRVAIYNEPAAAEFFSRLPISKDDRVLDVACGTGNLAVLAARKGCAASGVDIAANLIEQARTRAAAEGLAIQYQEGDAEALPYETASFDAVVSMYGVMFAPRPEIAARELLRVTRPGGVIAMANWTSEGFIGRLFAVFGEFLPPSNGVPSPLLWGSESIAQARLGAGVREFRLSRRTARLRYPFDVPGTVEFFRTYYGPTQRAFAALPPEKQRALRARLEAVQSEHNVSKDPAITDTPAEYLQVIAIRKAA